MSNLKVVIGKPMTVAQSPVGEKRWGYWQFPRAGYCPGSSARYVSFNVCEDSARDMGVKPRFFIQDGTQWVLSPEQSALRDYGLLLPDGDRLSHYVPPSVAVAGLQLPAPLGQRIGAWGSKYVAYAASDLAPELANIRFLRCKKGAEQWVEETAEVDDPDGIRESIDDLFPLFGGSWFHMKIAPDNSLLLAGYGFQRLFLNDVGRKGGPAPHKRIFFLRSTDGGRKLQLQGTIPYQPDTGADTLAMQREGFGEPGFEFAEDGTIVCFIRTDDGFGIGPMYISRSHDLAKTWTKPEVFHPFGVSPQVLRLENNVMVLSYGRPGVDIRFSGDGGRNWTEPSSLVPISPGHRQVDSCGYTALVATGKNSCLIAYSHFRHKDDQGQERKAILARDITVAHCV